MFEREIKFIYDFNLNKVNKLGPYFTFEQLTTVDLHPAILNYISAELNYIIFEDRQKLLKNSVFDYSGEKITHYFSLITDEVKKTKRLSFEYVSKLILHASSFTINYLVRPNWTLSKFVFDEGDHKTSTEIKQILNYAHYYNYLKKIIVSYINSKKILSMNSAEFSELLDKVDKLGAETYLPSIISTALKSMSEFFNIGEVQKNKIPLTAIELFLEEKKLTNHLERIQMVFGEDKSQKVTVTDLQKILGAIMQVQQEFVRRSEAAQDSFVIEEPFLPIERNEIETDPLLSEPDDTGFIEDDIPNMETQVTTEQNDEINVPAHPPKFRIRVDKDNEIEPIEDEVESEPVEDEAEYEPTEEETEQFAEEAPEPEQEDEDITITTELFDKQADISEDEQDEQLTGGAFTNTTEEDQIPSEEDSQKEADEELFGHREFVPSFKDYIIPNYDEVNDQDVSDEEENVEININEPEPDVMEEEQTEQIQEELTEQPEPEIMEEPEEKESMLKSILKITDEEVKEEQDVENDREKENDQEYDEEPNYKSNIKQEDQYEAISTIDIAELLEHKDMTRIIEVIFDYDIEEFSATLDAISKCSSLDDANKTLNETFKTHNINRSSKEAESLKSIISQYFKRS